MNSTNKKMKIIIGVTGASGAIYAERLLFNIKQLRENFEDISVVFTEKAFQVWEYELNNKEYLNTGFDLYDNNDFFAPFASGSAQYDAMIICPCSMGTLSKIATGSANDLISRAADVIIKERKKLILAVREAPYNLIHIENMKTVTMSGGIICPASPSFYSKPKDILELTDTVINRVLQLAGIETNSYKWGNNN
jgi:4-hydroxy-3-polyprenylbenzoate decarboxylase